MTSIPKRIFIVPYRNRPEQKFFFCKYMQFLLEYMTEYEVYFSHQADTRSFNRGGVKNIGFLAMKDKYPNDYKNITFIFNDLDTIPFNRIFEYDTTPGIVKHYYGFEHSLGGIVVIKGGDFEQVNGYPNFWSWGLEDSCLQKRCLQANFLIDRSHFYKIGSPEILQLFDGMDRIINKKDPHKLQTDTGNTGLRSIHKLQYTIDRTSINEKDNIYQSVANNYWYININNFLSETHFEDDEYYTYDIREPINKITNPDPRRQTTDVNATTENWANISYYPTTQERKDMMTAAVAKRPVQTPPQTPQPTHAHTRPAQYLHYKPVNGFPQNYTRIKGGGYQPNTNTRLGVAKR